MKVLVLANIYPTDEEPYSGIFIHRQVIALKEKIEVIVLKLDLRSIRKKRKFGFHKTVVDGIVVYTYSFPCGPVPWLLQHLYLKFALIAFKKVIEREGTIDILHSHFTVMGCCAAKIKGKYNLPVVLTEHSSALIYEHVQKNTVLQCKCAYQNADILLAVGSNLKKCMQYYTINEIKVIPNVLSPSFCVEIREGRENKEFIFISVVGMATRDKKLDVLIDSFINLHNIYKNIKLYIFGEGKLLDDLKKKVSVLNLEEKILFKGIVSNEKLPEIYQYCHCFVLPSVKETFGMVYIEAAACGLPLIGCYSGGTTDFITENNGVFAENNNENALKDSMEYVMLNYKQYSAQKISEDMHRKFGAANISEQLINVYDDLIRIKEDVEY